MNLEKKLEECGYRGDAKQFSDTVLETFQSMFTSWTDEEMLFRPTEAAAPFVNAVRKKVKFDVPEDLICRTLVNRRKHP